MKYTHKQLSTLPMLRPAKRQLAISRKCSLGWGTPVMKFGDECKNGHNTFSITVDGGDLFGGCCHDEIRSHWPELSHLIKWHLCSDDGPMHYIANTVYHAENGDLAYARSSAIAPHATLEQLTDKQWLTERLPELMEQFAQVMQETFSLNK